MRSHHLLIAASLLALGLAAQVPGKGADNAFFTGPGTQGATLNGAPLLPGTTVLAGETVTTSPTGVVIMAPTHGAGGVLALGGNSVATVQKGAVNQAFGTDALQVKQGDALVGGHVAITTPQGETFQPTNANTRFVVNAGGTQSSMGVLNGAVDTISPVASAPKKVVPAGQAVNVTLNSSGNLDFNPIKITQVQAPSATAAVTTKPAASQSQ